MAELGKTIDKLNHQKLSDKQVYDYINALFPLADNASELQKKNLLRLKEDMKARYFDAPDLQHIGKNAYRFINAVSDFATHAKPLKERANYKENLFARTVDGNAMIDKAYEMVKAAWYKKGIKKGSIGKYLWEVMDMRLIKIIIEIFLR